MIRFLLITFALTAIMALAVIAAQRIGSGYESPFMTSWKAYLCDPQPCWHGIHPGVTTFDQATNTLQADDSLMVTTSSLGMTTLDIDRFGASAYMTEDFATHNVDTISLSPLEGITLANLIDVFGDPVVAEACELNGDYVMIVFRGSIYAEISTRQLSHLTTLSPSLVMRNLTYSKTLPSSRQADYHVFKMTPWHGFSRLKTYPCIN